MAGTLEMRPNHCGVARFWPWPFGFDPKSSIALAASEDDVKDHIPQDVSLGMSLLYQKHSVWSGEILPKFGFALDVIVEARIKNLTTCRQRQTPLQEEVS